MDSICPPALIYLAFSLTQIVIDTFKGLYNTAFLKFIVMITITFLLNALCQGGMSIISWVLVFIPFIFMTVIVAILLYVFGLDAATGTLNFKCDAPNSNPNSNLIYSSTTASSNTNTNTCSNTSNSTNTTSSMNSPSTSSDPQYQ
jgi:ABC-type bacteriocin/lantibiotic exporter with double-glycine peptidase domain